MGVRNPLQLHIEQVLEAVRGLDGGAVASYIPALASVDPDRCAIALATVDGHLYAAGDVDVEFSIQSVSKPFTYALALTEAGFERVDHAIDVEPSGEAYNQISLGEQTGRPANALINAGAIAATSMLPRAGRAARLERFYGALAGRQLRTDLDVAAQEFDAGHRNLALAHLMQSFGVLGDDSIAATRDYSSACATLVTCRDLALMAATLAAGGAQPVTGEQLIDPLIVQRVLSVMAMCGMYDDAGGWMVRVGLPGKSGVGGGIIAVAPGQMAMAVYSPRLDAHGNSVRGLAVCERLSHDLELHMMNGSAAHRSTIRARTPLAELPSPRPRTPAERDALRRIGNAELFTVQGRLTFAGLEMVLRALVASRCRYCLLDLRRVTQAGPFVLPALRSLGRELRHDARELVLIDEGSVVPAAPPEARLFARRRDATAWVEEQLLLAWAARTATPTPAAELPPQ